MSFPPWIEGGKEILEFSEAEGELEILGGRGGVFFRWRESNVSGSCKGGTHDNDANWLLANKISPTSEKQKSSFFRNLVLNLAGAGIYVLIATN